MEKIDYSYEVTDEQLRAYAEVSLLDRLRRLEDLVRFTALMRTATSVHFDDVPQDAPSPQPSHRK